MVLYILYFLEKVVADIQELKQTLIINTIHLNTPGDMSSLQIAIKSTLLINPLKEAFKCLICHGIIQTSPTYFSTCCKQLIACSECIPRLGIECPHCRSEDFETIAVNTFDSVIATLGRVLED